MSTVNVDNVLDIFSLNELVVEHKIQSQELLNLQQIDVNYADHIKSNLTEYVAKSIVPRMTFTKSQNPELDEHIFRGRVWVFTKSELQELIEKVRNV